MHDRRLMSAGILASAAMMAQAMTMIDTGHQIGPGERRLRGGTRLEVERTREITSRDKSKALKRILAK